MKSPVWAEDFENLPPIQEEGKPIVWRIPWLKFIQAWFVLPHEDNPFQISTNLGKPDEWENPNRKLIVGMNTEQYCARANENEEFQVVFLVTLNNAEGTAKIELFDEKYIEQAEKFSAELKG